MKKMMFVFFMVMAMVMSANAQVPAGIYQGPERVVNTYLGWAYLENHTKVCFRNYPCGGNWVKVGMSIPDAYMYAMYEAAMEEEMHYMPSPTSVANYGAYGVAGMPVGVYGLGESSGFSLKVGKHSISTSSSKYGAYESGSLNVKVGDVQFGTYHSGVSKAAKQAAAQQLATTGCYTRGASSASYETQKKADAKAATARYSNMKKNNVVASGNTRSTASNKKVVQVNLLDAGL